MKADLAIGLAPNEAGRQPPAQFAPRGLIADSAIEASPQHMQFGFTHRALEPQQEAVVEQGRIIGKSGQIDQSVPFGIIAREP